MKNEGKIVILRHDVDSPFVYRKNFLKKALNRIYLSNSELPGKSIMPGYLEALNYLLELEAKFQAPGTFFFRTVTCPSSEIVRKMLAQKHEIAFHADRIDLFENFQNDLNKLQESMNLKIDGFSKHGFAKVRSGGSWDENRMIRYANLAKLKYLAQGVDHPDWEEPKLIDGVFIFGHHKTIKDTDFDDLVSYVKSKKWPMLMLHPEDLFIKGVEEKFLKILQFVKTITVKESLKLVSQT